MRPARTQFLALALYDMLLAWKRQRAKPGVAYMLTLMHPSWEPYRIHGMPVRVMPSNAEVT